MTALEAETLVVLSLFVLGVAVTFARLLRSRHHGVSLRMQIFLSLLATSFFPVALFSWALVSREATVQTPPEIAVEIVGIVLAMCVTLALAAAAIGRFVVFPLERLTRAAERIAAGERHARQCHKSY